MKYLPVAVLLVMAGCSSPKVEYRPIPTWLIPLKPTAPVILSGSLSCLSDEVYKGLVERDRQCWQYARELRALLESDEMK